MIYETVELLRTVENLPNPDPSNLPLKQLKPRNTLHRVFTGNVNESFLEISKFYFSRSPWLVLQISGFSTCGHREPLWISGRATVIIDIGPSKQHHQNWRALTGKWEKCSYITFVCENLEPRSKKKLWSVCPFWFFHRWCFMFRHPQDDPFIIRLRN